MNIRQQLTAQLHRDEGLSLRPYTDTVGKTTIGYGRNLSGTGISQDEADYMLANDITRAQTAVAQEIPWATNLDDARFGVLVNMAFNMGIGGLLSFRQALAMIRAGQYQEAAAQMLQSAWARQVGDRAQRLSKQMLTGVWQ